MTRALAGLATAAFALVAMVTAPHAVASPDDDFLKALAAGGISIPAKMSPQVIQGGHQVCDSWGSGASYTDTVAGVVSASGGTQRLAGTFVRAATNSFCPNYASKLP
jgi:purine nucleoside permease